MAEKKKLSRREMLKLLGAGTIGTIALNACRPTPPPATEAPAAAPEAAEPTPTTAPPAAEVVTLRLMTWGGTERAEKRDGAVRSVYPDLDERFKVESFVGGSGDFEVAEALRLALAAGTDIPNMVQLNYTQAPEFAAAGELLDLGDVYAPVKDDMYDGALALARYEGTFVCFPYEFKSKIFHYRGDMFEEAGIGLADMDTVDGFIEAGKKFHEKFPESYILNLGPQPVQYWIGELLSADPDARMADEDGNYLVTEKEAFSNAFKFLKDIYDAGITLAIDDWSSDWQQAFADEAIGGFMCASWVKFFLPGFAPEQGGKWVVDLWPKLAPLADQRYGSEAGGSVYVIPKRSEHTDLSAEYNGKIFLDKDGAMACYKATGMTPKMKSARDEFLALVGEAKRPEGMSDDEWKLQPVNFFGPEYFDLELKSYEYVRIFPYDPSAAAEITILTNWLARYMADEVGLEEALAGAQADMESQIGNPFQV